VTSNIFDNNKYFDKYIKIRKFIRDITLQNYA